MISKRDLERSVRKHLSGRVIFQRILIYAVLGTVALTTLFPFAWMASGAFKTIKEIFRYPPTIIPRNPTFNNFVDVFSQVPFSRYMLNSFIVAISVVVISVVLHSLAAYSFARLRYPGRDVIFLMVLSCLMIPFYAIIIPVFLIVKKFGWIDTYWGLIVPVIPNAYWIFLIRQFVMTIPVELEETALIEGCSRWKVFWLIIFPLLKPINLTFGVLCFIMNWDAFLWPMIVTNTAKMRLVQVGMVDFMGDNVTRYDLQMAASLVAIIPSLILFATLQKHLTESIKLSGLKL